MEKRNVDSFAADSDSIDGIEEMEKYKEEIHELI